MLHGKRERIRILAPAALLPKCFLKGGEFRLGLREGNAGLDAAHDHAEMVRVHAGRQTNRDCELDSTGAFVGTGLHHADDGIRLVVDQDGLTQDVRVRGVTILPEPVREDHHMVVARVALLGQEVATEENRLPDRPAVHTWSYGEPTFLIGTMVRVGEVENQPRLKGKALERVTLRCKLGVIIALGGDALALVVIPDHHQLIGVRIGQRCQERSPNNAEDGHIRSDPERKRERSNGCEAWVLAQLPQRVTKIFE